MDAMEQLDQVYKTVSNVNDQLVSIWLDQLIFTWRWWFGVFLSIGPWLLWLRYRDKAGTARLLFVALVVGLSSSVLDMVGMVFGLWHYDWKVLPFIPTYLPWDLALLPVAVMFFLQYKPKIHPIVKAVVFGGITAFIFEPFFVWIGLYHAIAWKYVYSFVIYIPLYLSYNAIFMSKLLTNQMQE